MTQQYKDQYKLYLNRFDGCVGSLPVGEYGTWSGQLIQKMTLEEYVEAFEHFQSLGKEIHRIMNDGLTLSDHIHTMYKESAAKVLEEPEQFL